MSGKVQQQLVLQHISVKIAVWNPGSSTRIHRQHHQNDGGYDGVGEPFGAGAIMALDHIQITNA